jgi:hypothetical protein
MTHDELARDLAALRRALDIYGHVPQQVASKLEETA